MKNLIARYQENGFFTFKQFDRLSQQCNAPRHSSGIYLIYKESEKESNLIYIGISGREGQNGEIIHRKDGIGGRIVKGKQFGEPRRNSWPNKMKDDKINTLVVRWFVTYGKYNSDFPRKLERGLLSIYFTKHKKLPQWNKEI